MFKFLGTSAMLGDKKDRKPIIYHFVKLSLAFYSLNSLKLSTFAREKSYVRASKQGSQDKDTTQERGPWFKSKNQSVESKDPTI